MSGRGPPRRLLAEQQYDGADALVIVTEWEQFRALDFERLRGVIKQPVLVDLRNVYRPEDIEGFAYHGHRPGGRAGAMSPGWGARFELLIAVTAPHNLSGDVMPMIRRF